MSKRGRLIYGALAGLLIASNSLFGLPADMLIDAWNESKIVDNLYRSQEPGRLPRLTGRASAANFSIQTGYYLGNGSTQTISGVGFQPQAVIIKSDTATGTGVWKTSAMPASNTAFFSATGNNTGTLITFNTDGFSVANNATTNTANVRYSWTAFTGSDCTSSGTICVGTYTGNGANPTKITTGFQPSLVVVKRSTAVAANFRTASMPASTGNYFTTTAQNTTGGLFTTFVSDGFNVGSAVNNVSGGTFYYIAFKAVAGVMAEGTYSGNATDNRDITGFGTGNTPNLVFVKNSNASTTNNRIAYTSNTHSYGDHSSRLDSAAANVVNVIQRLQDNGFQVGTGAQANGSGNTIYWAAFGGAAALPPGSGTFEMAAGSYTGNGTSQSVSGLGFTPDLVTIKDNAANQSVFRTSLMAANNSAYLANAATNFTGGITSLNADGFSLGASAAVNASGNTYQWQAFGNAYKPTTRTGSGDFTIGSYTGNGVDNRNVAGLPFQPDMVTAKRNSTTAGVWRSSANTGDSSSFFTATADGANRIQALNSDGFQVGTNAAANGSGSLYHWFGFKVGSNFWVGSYTGTGSAQNIDAGLRPNLVWVKRSTAVSGVQRSSSLAGDATQYFLATANATGRITSLVGNGFVLGTQTETNATTGTYRYAAWRIDPPDALGVDVVDATDESVANPSVLFGSVNASLSCQDSTGSLGSSSQKLQVTNTTSNGNWTLAIAATGGSTANWSNGTNVYDFNDANGAPAGCSDGGDTDSIAGRLSIDPSAGTLTAGGLCGTTGVTKGSSSAFSQGSVDAVTLITAASSQTECSFYLTGVSLSQKIPGETPAGVSPYVINMTLTVTAN